MNQSLDVVIEEAKYCLNCKTKPCSTSGCPLGNDIPTFIRQIKERTYKEAYETLCLTTVLPAICGRICPHMKQCMGKCVRGIKGNSVEIGELEAFIGDKSMEDDYSLFEGNIKEKNGKKVAVIGSGPASLTCSAFLAKEGFEVTIYEKQEKLGGILRYGIPEFRLEKKLLDSTISKILSLGIHVRTSAKLGVDYTLEEIKSDYDYVFVGIGANQSARMGIEGEDLNGIYGANELLESGNHPDYTGKNVSIIGGGNVAMDIARTVNRMGAKSTNVIYRRARSQMPAEQKEIDEAIEEGVNFLFQNNIVKAFGDKNGFVSEIECIKTILVKVEGETREVPVDIQNSNYKMDMDMVIMAVGSNPEKEIVDGLNLELNKWGCIAVDDKKQTSVDNIYSGGDIAGDKQTIAWAARAGREAAESIIEKEMSEK